MVRYRKAENRQPDRAPITPACVATRGQEWLLSDAKPGELPRSHVLVVPAGCTHSNRSNNHAIQFTGSFSDQKLWFRKTIDNPSMPLAAGRSPMRVV